MQTSYKLTRLFWIILLITGIAVSASAQTSFPAPGVSDQQTGWMLVYPYYTSNSLVANEDTWITISNVSATNTAAVHMFFLDGASCAQADLFICLTPNASQQFKASEIDPSNSGYLIAYVVAQTGPNAGLPDTAANLLIGNAFLNIPSRAVQGNYGAEAFNSTSRPAQAVLNPGGFTTDITFFAPNRFAVELQSPLNVRNQTIVMAGLSGDISQGLTGAGQVGIGQLYNGNERPFGSFSGFIPNGCLSLATINTASPRIPIGIMNVIPSGQVGTMKFGTTASVGLLLTGQGPSGRAGVRSLHKIGVAQTVITAPVFAPSC